jgi:hypothetical protein
MPALHDWFRALSGGDVLSDSATALMFEEHPPEIAYGWFYLRDDLGTAIAHGGDTEGTQTYLHFRPDRDLVVALGINDRRGWRGPILRGIKMILERDSMPPLPPPVVSLTADSLRALAGSYRIADDRIEFRVEGGALRADAVGPAAVAFVTGADSARAVEMRERSEAAARFLGALVRGDSATVATALSEEGRPASFWRVWDALSEDHPAPPRGFEVLGTVPGRAGRTVTFSRIRFATGDEILRLVWRPHLAGWGTGGETPSRVFRAAAGSRLVSYDPAREGWVALAVENEPGAVVALTDAYGRRAVRSPRDEG